MSQKPSLPEVHEPYISSNDDSVAEFTLRAVILGCIFGILFGAATVYLALKAGLTVSASIPIAVLAISMGRAFLKTSILENNIIQTIGSAGESVAAGVVFTLPAFLFLSNGIGVEHFNYGTITMIAIFGGILGVLMMIPLRRALIVKEHANLPYPEGTACAQVLIAGEKGGSFARTAYYGLAVAMLYAFLQRVIHLIAETPRWGTTIANKYLPAGTVAGEITPEYLGVGYIIGPKIAGVLVAGGVLASFGLIPLLATLTPTDTVIAQLDKLDLMDPSKPNARFDWDPAARTIGNPSEALYRAYVRQIGAGAVAAAGFITLLKTLPTIFSSFKESLRSIRAGVDTARARTDNDLSLWIVIGGSLVLVAVMAILPNIPGDTITQKLVVGALVIIFGFFFVTVSSRIVGIIGSSNNPISGMTIATIMATSLVFIGFGFTGELYEPMALVVGSMICIAAANAGATSQDLKTGYLVGATPRYQQISLFIGVIVSALVIGFTIWYLNKPSAEMTERGIQFAIGEKYNAPQATLMATLIKGLLSFNLDWQFVLVGMFVAVTMELCGVKSLSFAVGLYLPLATTLPIWIGGVIRGIADKIRSRRGEAPQESELGKGSLFATGLVAGGALAGVIVALATVDDGVTKWLAQYSVEHSVSGAFARLLNSITGGNLSDAAAFQILGVVCFALMALTLFIFACKRDEMDYEKA